MKYYVSRNLDELEVITHSYIYRSEDGIKVELLSDEMNMLHPDSKGWILINYDISILKEIDQETLLDKCSGIPDDGYAIIIVNEFKRLFYEDVLTS